MHLTLHAGQRMNQRGISRRLVDFTLRHGRLDGNKTVLDRRESLALIDALNEELRLAKQIADKGGVAVVDGRGAVITTYNLYTRHARRSRSQSHGHGSTAGHHHYRVHTDNHHHRHGGPHHV
jgi:hypothetical protein